MREYRLQYLNNKEFEALSRVNPRYANTKDDAGFADMVTNRIYVRKSGDALTDQFVTMHEIEEILAKNSSHEDEFNIRHKKGGALRNIIPAALAFVPYVGPFLSAAANAGMNQYAQSNHPEQLGPPSIGSAIGQAATGYFGGKALSGAVSGGIAGGANAGAGLLSKAGGIISGAGKGAMNALGFGIPAQGAPYPAGTPVGVTNMRNFSQFPGATAAGLSSAPVSAVPQLLKAGQSIAGSGATSTLGFQGPVTREQAAQGYSNLSQIPQTQGGVGATGNLPSINAPAPTPTPNALPGAPGGSLGVGGGGTGTAANTSLLKSLLGDNWRQTLLGASIPLLGQSAGSMFGTTPTPEPFTPEQSQLFNETAQMVRQGANVQLTPEQQQAISANYDYALKQAKINLTDRYKQLRPGSDIENDSQFRNTMVELERNIATDKANALAATQLGLGTQQTQMMSELAAMDIQTLAMKAGIKYQEAKDFKGLLARLGFMVAQSGQPVMYTSR